MLADVESIPQNGPNGSLTENLYSRVISKSSVRGDYDSTNFMRWHQGKRQSPVTLPLVFPSHMNLLVMISRSNEALSLPQDLTLSLCAWMNPPANRQY